MVDKITSRQPMTVTTHQPRMVESAKQDLTKLKENEQQVQKQREQTDQWNVWNNKEKLEEITSALNHFLQPVYTSLKFVLHEKLDEYYVLVIDKSTEEVIREIPPEKLLDMYAAMAEYLGLIVDEKI